MQLLRRKLYLFAERVGIREGELFLMLVLVLTVTGSGTYYYGLKPQESPFTAETYTDFRAEFHARAKRALAADSIKTARFYHPAAFLVAEAASPAAKKGSKKATSKKKSDVVVNINTATLVELQSMPGIGPKTAADILTFREKNGAFATVDDLLKIKGIGAKKLEKLKPHVQL